MEKTRPPKVVEPSKQSSPEETKIDDDIIEELTKKFWYSILEYEKKGKVTSNEVELADRSVQNITGWSDPVDDNTLLVEVLCGNHEVFVDEKSKRMEEQGGPSKKHETRSTRKKEDAKAS